MYNYTGGFKEEFFQKIVKVGESDVKLKLWDCFRYDWFSGGYQFEYIYKTNSCIVAFDITNRESY